MQAQDIMTSNPATCLPSTPLPEVARLMVDHDCGCIPVVDGDHRPVGAITDRDITCRVVARDENPSELTAADCMSAPCVTVPREATIDSCCETLEGKQIRRAIVVDDDGVCCGIVAQADIAAKAHDKTQAVLSAVSRPSASPAAASAH
jgi:CBS domain-containing protein